MILFGQTSEPTTMTYVLLLMCVYSRMRHSHERRVLGALLFMVSRSAPASTDS